MIERYGHDMAKDKDMAKEIQYVDHQTKKPVDQLYRQNNNRGYAYETDLLSHMFQKNASLLSSFGWKWPFQRRSATQIDRSDEALPG
jgi:tRNA uridine 5-carbamoylmethylation protein Kti12